MLGGYKSSNNPFIQNGVMNGAAYENLGGPEQVGQRYPGLLGAVWVGNNGDALKVSKTSVGTLYMGAYQLVKFTSAITRGELVFWDTLANNGQAEYEVTHTPTTNVSFRAGVALMTDASATGRYGWIQIGGLASMLYSNSAPAATLGTNVIQGTTANTPVANVATVTTLADATDTTSVLFVNSIVGKAYSTPTQNDLARVWMNPMGFYPNVAQ